MSNFDENRKMKEETRKKNDTRREKLAGYFFDLSKLIFAALVVGTLSPIAASKEYRTEDLATIIFGATSSYLFAYFANKILK